jgi:hypothetical protein
MSKKIIAVAAAAALALTALVAPANAAQASLTLLPTTTVNGTVTGDGLISTTAWVTPVPSQDVLRLTETASRSVLSLEIKTRSNNAAVTVTSTGAVKLITAAQLAATTTTTTATGTQSLSLTSNDSGVATFYAYSTSTTAGSITATESGTTPASNTGWVIGSTSAANAYKLAAVSPTIGGIGSLIEYSATVVDMFGNAITTATVASATLGGDATGADSPMLYDAVTKVYEGDFTNRTTAGQVALLVSIAVSADTVTAFGAKSTSVFVNINGADLQATVTALQAQVAAQAAILAVSRLDENSVTQKKYNTLVRKWNAAFPSQRIALKK